MTVPSALSLWQENAGANYHARDYRRFLEAIIFPAPVTVPGTGAGGVFRPTGQAVSQRGAGANMSVDVAAGAAYVDGSNSSTQGGYFVYNDAALNVVIAAADPTNGRFDIIGVRIRDTEYVGGSNDAAIIVVQGTAAAVPAEPTLPDNFLTLARVTVGAGVSSITNANILDRRRQAVTLGGILPCTSTTRPSVGLYEGLRIYETDTNLELIYNGSVWIHLTAQSASVATAQTSSTTSYADLATVGPAITALTGSEAILDLHANFNSSAGAQFAYIGCAVSGATTSAAADARAAGPMNIANLGNGILARRFKMTGLSPGQNVFTLKYKVGNATSTTFLNRDLTVTPVP